MIKAILSIALVCLLTQVSAAGHENLPVLPKLYIDEGACPFEGCQYGKWTAEEAVDLFSKPEGKQIGHIAKGESVDALGGEVRTVPTEVMVEKDYSFVCIKPGMHEHTHKFKKGETFYLLTYEGEGVYKVWYKGEIFEVEFYYEINKDGIVYFMDHPTTFWASFPGKKRGRSDWWAKVKTKNGKTGWVLPSGKFSGTDAFE